jgi:hypothetical protein
MNAHWRGLMTRFQGARSWWAMMPVPSAGMSTCQRASGGGRKPVTASWKPRISRATRRRRSPGSSRWKLSGQAMVPGMKVRTSRPSSSRPSGRGAPRNPAACKWPSRACTAGVHGPAGRRTVSPIRTTPLLTFPPPCGISVIWAASSGVPGRRVDPGGPRCDPAQGLGVLAEYRGPCQPMPVERALTGDRGPVRRTCQCWAGGVAASNLLAPLRLIPHVRWR